MKRWPLFYRTSLGVPHRFSVITFHQEHFVNEKDILIDKKEKPTDTGLGPLIYLLHQQSTNYSKFGRGNNHHPTPSSCFRVDFRLRDIQLRERNVSRRIQIQTHEIVLGFD